MTPANVGVPTITLLRVADLPNGVLKAAAPLTLEEAEAWAQGCGATVVYWLPATRTAFALVDSTEQEQA